MKYRVVSSSPFRSAFVVAGMSVWLALSAVGQSTGSGMISLVEDDASLLTEEVRLDLVRELEEYREATDCWILVKTLPEAGRKRHFQIFGRAWESWGRPKCAVVFFLIRESTSATMMMSPAMESRLTPVEIDAILRGVVVPRFTADDEEGAVLAGVQSLQAAIDGDLDELPDPFRPRGSDVAIGIGLIVLAAVAFSGAGYQIATALKEKSENRRSSR